MVMFAQPVARLRLRGGPLDGVYDVWTRDMDPYELLDKVYPNYEYTTVNYRNDDHEDPLARLDWVGIANYRGDPL